MAEIIVFVKLIDTTWQKSMCVTHMSRIGSEIYKNMLKSVRRKNDTLI